MTTVADHRDRLRDDRAGPVRADDLASAATSRSCGSTTGSTNLDVRPLPFTVGDPPGLRGDARPPDRPARPARCSSASRPDPSMGDEATGLPLAEPARRRPRAGRACATCAAVRPREDVVFGGHWATDLRRGLAGADRRRRRAAAWRSSSTRAVFPPRLALAGVRRLARPPPPLRSSRGRATPSSSRTRSRPAAPACWRRATSLETEVAFVLFGGLDAVSTVEADGAGFAVG